MTFINDVQPLSKIRCLSYKKKNKPGYNKERIYKRFYRPSLEHVNLGHGTISLKKSR